MQNAQPKSAGRFVLRKEEYMIESAELYEQNMLPE